jgi:hypothetical protein
MLCQYSWSHLMRRRAGLAQWCSAIRKLAQEGARVAWINDLLDPKGFGRAEGRAQFREPLSIARWTA